MRLFQTVALSMALLFSTTAHADADEDEDSKLHHHLAAFVGIGFEEDKNGHYEDNAAIGVKYGLQFHEKWGVGVEVEKLYDEKTNRVWVIALPLKYYLNENWRLFLGPGYEFKGKKDK